MVDELLRRHQPARTTSTVVPAPGLLTMSSRPPIRAARSRIVSRPKCSPASRDGLLLVGDEAAAVVGRRAGARGPSRSSSAIRTCVAWPWRMALVTASWPIRSSCRSTSAEQRCGAAGHRERPTCTPCRARGVFGQLAQRLDERRAASSTSRRSSRIDSRARAASGRPGGAAGAGRRVPSPAPDPAGWRSPRARRRWRARLCSSVSWISRLTRARSANTSAYCSARRAGAATRQQPAAASGRQRRARGTSACR